MKTTREPLSDENREKLFVRIKDENVSIHERADMVRILEWDDALRAALERAEKAEKRVALLEGALIKYPDELIRIADQLRAWGFGATRQDTPLREDSNGSGSSVGRAPKQGDARHDCEAHQDRMPGNATEDGGSSPPQILPPKTVPDNQMDYPPAAVHLDRSMVSVHGSDGCSSCDTGRITIYAASRQCLDCRTRRPTRSYSNG